MIFICLTIVLLPLSPEPAYVSITRSAVARSGALSSSIIKTYPTARSCIPAVASSSPPPVSGQSSDCASSGLHRHCCRCYCMPPLCNPPAVADRVGDLNSVFGRPKRRAGPIVPLVVCFRAVRAVQICVMIFLRCGARQLWLPGAAECCSTPTGTARARGFVWC